MEDRDRTEAVLDAVAATRDTGGQLRIRGRDSKQTLARVARGASATPLDLATHAGVVDYAPEELVVTLRCGTSIADALSMLGAQRQTFAFEPPRLGDDGSIGGMIAAGMSGPARPWSGAVRDALLGVVMVNGLAERLTFGGTVLKNVAGYDVARLQAGALGTLGALLDVSLRVAPLPDLSMSLAFEMSRDDALRQIRAWASRSLPLSAAAIDTQPPFLRIRLSGSENVVLKARRELGGDLLDGDAYWADVRDLKHKIFDSLESSDERLWRLTVPPASTDVHPDQLIDWGGGLRWWRTNVNAEEVYRYAADCGGCAELFFAQDPDMMLDAQSEAGGSERARIEPLFARIKHAFDPDGIFNPGM